MSNILDGDLLQIKSVTEDKIADGIPVSKYENDAGFITEEDVPTTLPPSGTAGGLLSGSYPDPRPIGLSTRGFTIQNLDNTMEVNTANMRYDVYSSSATNGPNENSGFAITGSWANANAYNWQIAFDATSNTNAIFIRKRVGTAFTEWERIITEKDLDYSNFSPVMCMFNISYTGTISVSNVVGSYITNSMVTTSTPTSNSRRFTIQAPSGYQFLPYGLHPSLIILSSDSSASIYNVSGINPAIINIDATNGVLMEVRIIAFLRAI